MFGLKKLFGGNKKSESSSSQGKNGKFFMELDEDGENQLTKAVNTVTSKVGDVTSQVGDATSQAASTVTSAVSNIVEDVKPGQTDAKQDQPVKKTAPEQKKTATDQKSKSRKQKNSPTGPAQVLQEKIPTSVESVSSESNGKGGTQPEAKIFAPKYLTPTTTQPRRRPGPSMAMFKDMARQVKTK